MYYILDALGEVIEEDITIVKIDVALGEQFIYEVAASDQLDALFIEYKRRLNISFYDHDVTRAFHLKDVIEYYRAGGLYDHNIRYFADTLSVIYEWCAKYRRVYMGRYYKEAYKDFVIFCRHTHTRSVTEMPNDLLEPMFNYIFCREHLNRHPFLKRNFTVGV